MDADVWQGGGGYTQYKNNVDTHTPVKYYDWFDLLNLHAAEEQNTTARNKALTRNKKNRKTSSDLRPH